MTELTRRMALVSLLVTTACGAHSDECPLLVQTRVVGGEIALLESQATVDERVAFWASHGSSRDAGVGQNGDAGDDAGGDAGDAGDGAEGEDASDDEGGAAHLSPHLTERRIIRVQGAASAAFALDDRCPSKELGCVRIGASWAQGLTFRRPPGPGAFALRDLGAKVCEFAPSDHRERAAVDPSIRCGGVDGTLVVREVAVDRFDAHLTLNSRDFLDPAPTAFGSAHLVVSSETVSTPCSSGGCGRVPGFGPR